MYTFPSELQSDGRNMVCAPFGADKLPPVGFNDLSHAWEIASTAAELGLTADEKTPSGVIFDNHSSNTIELQFDDYDAICWATAIHRAFDLKTVKGLSVCLRMLGLFKIMAENVWSRQLYSFDRSKKLKINKALLAAAAAAQLTQDGLFDPDRIKQETGVNQLTTASKQESGLKGKRDHSPQINNAKQT
ncbi:MAG: hypothetical protein RIF37_00680 [Rhodospirillaceae bacterium]